MKARLLMAVLILGLGIMRINISYAAELVNHVPVPQGDDAFEVRHDELTALLNWAAYLSGYETNGINPRLVFRPRQFFVDNACQGNQKCRVVGWYNDQGIVYIDDRMVSLEYRFARSLVVHEFVHYLQHISGEFDAGSCEAYVQREREAYATQREFIMAYGVVPSMSFHQHSCSVNTARKSTLVTQQVMP